MLPPLTTPPSLFLFLIYWLFPSSSSSSSIDLHFLKIYTSVAHVPSLQWLIRTYIQGQAFHVHVGLTKCFLQSLLAFCPPPFPIDWIWKPFSFLVFVLLSFMLMEVGILPTELCWLLFVKPSWFIHPGSSFALRQTSR